MALTAAASTLLTGLLTSGIQGGGALMNMVGAQTANNANRVFNTGIQQGQATQNLFGNKISLANLGLTKDQFAANEDQRGINNMQVVANQLNQKMANDQALKNRVLQLWGM